MNLPTLPRFRPREAYVGLAVTESPMPEDENADEDDSKFGLWLTLILGRTPPVPRRSDMRPNVRRGSAPRASTPGNKRRRRSILLIISLIIGIRMVISYQ